MQSDVLFLSLFGFLAVLLWWGRQRPEFPPDLVYWVTDQGVTPGAPAPVGADSFIVELLGLTPRTRIRILGEDRQLATLWPIASASGGLYRLRPGPRVSITTALPSPSRAERDLSPELIAVERDYRLTLEHSDRELILRIGYRPPRPESAAPGAGA